MALGTNHLANASTSVQEFIPEIWSDDIVAAYKSNLVLANLISKINHKGKKGDTIHIPKPTRGAANAKTVGSQVTLNQDNSSEVSVVINKHYEYSIVLEDIIAVQALNSLRRFHTDDAGYALGKQTDQDISLLWAGFQSGDATANTLWDAAVNGADGTTLFSATNYTSSGAITDAGIRTMLQTLDDADVPMDGRVMVIPPVMRNTLMGLSRFTEQAFTGESGSSNTIRNGKIGEIYGVEVYISTNCPWVAIDGAGYTTSADMATAFSDVDYSAGVTGTDRLGNTYDLSAAAATDHRVGAIFHKDALVLAEQQGVRSQAQYKQEYLGTLMTSDCIYGVAELRDDAGVAFVVPAN
jgi:N4-gp56 family major capsid protein